MQYYRQSHVNSKFFINQFLTPISREYFTYGMEADTRKGYRQRKSPFFLQLHCKLGP